VVCGGSTWGTLSKWSSLSDFDERRSNNFWFQFVQLYRICRRTQYTVRLGWNGWEHTCVSHQDSYFVSVDLMFLYLWSAFYVTLGTRMLHEQEVKTSRFGELFLRNGGPKYYYFIT
jgi:hypothetical protein